MNPQTYQKQLRYWSCHCCINALPSFLIAIFHLGLREQPLNIIAMILGVIIFILFYTFISTQIKCFTNPDSLIYKACKIAVIFRTITAIIALALVPTPLVFMSIDFVAGFWTGVLLGFDGENNNFFKILAWTLLEGLVLSIFLFLIALSTIGIMKLHIILYRDPTTK